MRMVTLLAGAVAIATSCLSATASPLSNAKNSTVLSRARRNLVRENVSPIEGMSLTVLTIIGAEGNPVKNLKFHMMKMETGKVYDTKTTDDRGDVFIFTTEKRSEESSATHKFIPSRTEPNTHFGIMWDYLPGKILSDSKMRIDEYYTEMNKVTYYKFFVDRPRVGKLPEAPLLQTIPYISSWWTDPKPIHDGRMAHVGWIPNWEKNIGVIEARLVDENEFPIAGSQINAKFLGYTDPMLPTDRTGTTFSAVKTDWDRKTYDLYIEQPKGKFDWKNKMRAHRYKDRWSVYIYKFKRDAESNAGIPQPAYIRGMVVDQNGKAVANHRVTVRTEDGLVVTMLLSDELGHVHFHLLSGTYYIFPIHKDDDPNHVRFSIPLVLTPGVKKETIQIPNYSTSATTAGPVSAIYRFMNEKGTPVVNQLITIKNLKGEPVFEGATDKEGSTTLALLRSSYVGSWAVSNASGSFPITVDGTGGTVQTSMPQIISKTYTFRSRNGIPLAGLEIIVKDSNGKLAFNGRTDGNGQISFDLVAGNYMVFPQYPPGQMPVSGSSISLDLSELGNGGESEFEISLTAESLNTVESASVEVPPVLESRIFGFIYKDANNNSVVDSGEALTGVKVSLFDAQNNTLGIASTSTKGEYIFDKLPEGNFTISFERASVPSMKAGDAIVEAISVQPMSQVQHDFRIQLSDVITQSSVAAIVYEDLNRNKVREPTEISQAGVVLSLTSESNTTFVSDPSGSDGRILIPNVPYGKYFVQLNLDAVPEFAGSQTAQWVNIRKPKISFGFALQRL